MRASIIGAVLTGAVVISCGPPPQPLVGKLWWSYGCDTSVMGQAECPTAPNEAIEGSSRRSPPPRLDVFCYIDPATNGAFNFRVGIEQTQGDGSKVGLTSVCGTASGAAPGAAQNSRVSITFGAATITGVAAGGSMGSCDVKVDTINATSIVGQLRCAGVRDNSMNFRRVNGVNPPSQFATPDPAWARFEFVQCVPGAGVCR